MASDRSRLLLVLQGLDRAGKDGTVKSVIGSMNPQGVRITAFGAPAPTVDFDVDEQLRRLGSSRVDPDWPN